MLYGHVRLLTVPDKTSRCILCISYAEIFSSVMSSHCHEPPRNEISGWMWGAEG